MRKTGQALLLLGVVSALVFFLGRHLFDDERTRPAEDLKGAGVVAFSEILAIPAATQTVPGHELSPLEERGKVLDERQEGNLSFGSAKRIRLVEAPDFDFPVLVSREVRIDPTSGEEIVFGFEEMAADRVIAAFGGDRPESELRQQLEGLGMRLGRTLGAGLSYEVILEDASLDSLKEGLATLEHSRNQLDLLYTEPNYIVHALGDSNDPSYLDGSLWGMSNSGQFEGLLDVDIDAPEGWSVRNDASSVVVAVVDTGINYLHEDLADNVWRNSLEIPANGIDDDGNGWVDDVFGINAVDGTGDPFDDNGHGTHCSGTIGAMGNNGLGVAGVAWKVQLMGLKFLGENGSGTTADAIRCLNYAVEMGAGVVSNSWGGGPFSQALYDAISLAEEAGVVFVAAAGNAAQDNDSVPSFPANYDLQNVISVAAIDRLGELSAFSNYGYSTVDIAAPGTDIVSTWIGGSDAYRTISGTSMAAPHVSGVLALLIAQYPNSGIEENIGRLQFGAKWLRNLEGKVRTGALVNLADSLAMLEVPTPPKFIKHLPASMILKEGESLRLAVEVESGTEVNYQWNLDGAVLEGANESVLEIESVSVADAGSYRVVASNSDGSSGSSTQVRVVFPDPILANSFDAEPYQLFSYGDGHWETYIFDSVEGGSSLRSGQIGDQQASHLFMDLVGPGLVGFYWRLSAERFWDFASLSVDGVRVAELRQSTDWTAFSLELPEERPYRLTWTYHKDESGSDGQDSLFLDGFTFEPLLESRPVFVEQPRGGIVGSISAYRLESLALGQNVSYQWLKNGVPLIGQTENTLLINGEDSDAAGSYSVLASNQYGSRESVSASIRVADIPVSIAGEPEDLEVQRGQSGFFKVEVEGSLPYSLQWYKDGRALAGENGDELFVESVDEGDEGLYHLEASNAYTLEPEVSEGATLTLVDLSLAPEIVKHPSSGYWQTGTEVRLSTAVEGNYPFTYQWFKDGRVIAGANERSLLFGAVEESDAGTYVLEARNPLGVTRSDPAEIVVVGSYSEGFDAEKLTFRISGTSHYVVQDQVTFDGEDALQSVHPDGALTSYSSLETEVSGPATYSFYWKQEVEFLPSIMSVFVDDAQVAGLRSVRDWQRVNIWIPEGEHQLSIAGEFEVGSVVWLDQMSLHREPVGFDQIESVVRQEGESIDLWVDVKGSGPLSYQWFHDGQAIPTETSPSMRLNGLTKRDIGSYRVDTVNFFGGLVGKEIVVVVVDDFEALVSDSNVALQLDGEGPWKGILGGANGVMLRARTKGSVSATVRGPGIILFEVGLRGVGCCSSVQVLVDGVEELKYSTIDDVEGFPDLRQQAIRISEGVHVVKWLYDQNDAGFGGSQAAYLANIKLTTNPVFSKHPVDRRTIEGEEVSFGVRLVDETDIVYQWFKDGVEIENANSGLLRIVEPMIEDDGAYHCVATDPDGKSTKSRIAQLDVVDGFYDAVGLEFGSLLGGGLSWEPLAGASPAGGPVLAFRPELASGYETMTFEVELPVGEKRAIEFWIRMSGAGEDTRVRVSENGGKIINLQGDFSWRKVVFPLKTEGENRISVLVQKGDMAPDAELWLTGFSLVDRPIFYSVPLSGSRYWGDSFELSAEVLGANPLAYRWLFEGESLQAGEGDKFVVERVSDLSAGNYSLEVANSQGVAMSGPAQLKLLAPDLGKAVGAPGTSILSEGHSLWEVDELEGSLGNQSLTAKDLGPQQFSDLLFWIRGPGELSLDWKFESKGTADNLAMFIGSTQVSGLYSDSGWVPFSFEIDDGLYPVRIRLSNRSGVEEPGGQAWVDAIRFSSSGAITFQDWSDRVFEGSSIGADDRLPEADWDSDGLPNFMEYALGKDPETRDTLPQPRFFGSRVVVDFELEPLADDIAFGFEVSRDLRSWYPLRSQLVLDLERDVPSATLFHAFPEDEMLETLFLRMAVYFIGERE